MSGTQGARWSPLVSAYLTSDTRVLGLFRIYFGGLLLFDLLRRVPVLDLLYSNDGVLPNHFVLYAPQANPQFSLFFAFSTPGEVRLAFALLGLVYLLYLVGYRTRLAQVLTLVGVTSLNARNLFLEDGGMVVTHLLAILTMFLPLGERYSVDALRRRYQLRSDPTTKHHEAPGRPVVSLWVLAITLQTAAIYFFNTVHKTGNTWARGEAVHWVLWQSRVATSLACWLRVHEPSWLSPVLTWGTLVVEGVIPVLLLLPLWQRFTRLSALLLALGLHLGIAALMNLGPFSYAMIGLLLLHLPTDFVDRVGKKLAPSRPSPPSITLAFEPQHPAALWVARVLASLDPRGCIAFEHRLHDPAPVTRKSDSPLAARNDQGPWATGADALSLALRTVPLVGQALAPLVSTSLGRAVIEGWLLPSKGGPIPRPRGVPPETGWPRLTPMREVAAAVFCVAVGVQMTHDNASVPAWARVPQPQLFAAIIQYPRILQGWRMFAPDAPTEDGMLVVDAVTADGRHIDPFTDAPTDFEAGLHGPVAHPATLCDYLFGIQSEGNERYRGHLVKYLERWHEVKRRPASDRIVSFEVFWVDHASPPPGSTTPGPTKRRLVVSSQ